MDWIEILICVLVVALVVVRLLDVKALRPVTRLVDVAIYIGLGMVIWIMSSKGRNSTTWPAAPRPLPKPDAPSWRPPALVTDDELKAKEKFNEAIQEVDAVQRDSDDLDLATRVERWRERARARM